MPYPPVVAVSVTQHTDIMLLHAVSLAYATSSQLFCRKLGCSLLVVGVTGVCMYCYICTEYVCFCQLLGWLCIGWPVSCSYSL